MSFEAIASISLRALFSVIISLPVLLLINLLPSIVIFLNFSNLFLRALRLFPSAAFPNSYKNSNKSLALLRFFSPNSNGLFEVKSIPIFVPNSPIDLFKVGNRFVLSNISLFLGSCINSITFIIYSSAGFSPIPSYALLIASSKVSPPLNFLPANAVSTFSFIVCLNFSAISVFSPKAASIIA